LEALYIDKKLTEKELNEKLQLMVSQYNEKQNEFVDLLGRGIIIFTICQNFIPIATVSEHQEREQYIRALEEIVDSRDNLLSKLASELKTIENSLTEATYQVFLYTKSEKYKIMCFH
jgi:flagellar biosynthesis chaperone FliJ